MRSYTSGFIYKPSNKLLRNTVAALAGNTFIWTEEGIRYTTTFSEHLRGIRKVGQPVKEVIIEGGIHHIPDFWVAKGWVKESPLVGDALDKSSIYIDYLSKCDHFLVCSSHNKYVYYTSRGNFSMTFDKSKAFVFRSFSELVPHLTPKCRLVTSNFLVYLSKPSLLQSEQVVYQGICLFIVKV